MTYYNYHAIAKRLIERGNLLSASLFQSYRHISPALVLYFENHRPIPIRQYMWRDYLELIERKNIKILNPDNISTNF